MLRQEGPLIVLDAKFPEEVTHELLGTIAQGTHSLEFYWLDRWYNVFRFAKPDGQLRSFYCNVNIPPKFADGILSYVDLDLDILVEPDFSYRIVDWEDFENNVAYYSEDVQINARKAVDELITLIETKQFPFSHD